MPVVVLDSLSLSEGLVVSLAKTKKKKKKKKKNPLKKKKVEER
jgi:hypothetical protein